MNIKAALPRYQFAYQPGGVCVVIPARRYWFQILPMCLWLCFWANAEMTVGTQLAGSAAGAEGPFMYLWLALWTTGGGMVLTGILCQLFGKEQLLVEAGSLTYRVQLFGLRRTRRYLLSQVSQLQVVDVPASKFCKRPALILPFIGKASGAIAFDYGAEQVQIAMSLDSAEARLLMPQLKEHLPAGLFAQA
jgi:hypothetical protein